jgi:predicted transcriptional regulator YdeE
MSRILLLFIFLFNIFGVQQRGELEKKIDTVHCKSIKIIGVELKTSNENGRAFKEIPMFWQNFMQNRLLDKISNKTSSDLYSVYTNFENEGTNNRGVYSMIIGAPVNSFDQVAEGFVTIEIPEAEYAMFAVQDGENQLVAKAWQDIWKLSLSDNAFDQNRTYFMEYEHYKASGGIDIYVGVKG